MSNNHILIDREKMMFIAAAETSSKASFISWNDYPDTETAILPLDSKRYFSTFGVLELMTLYRNASGKLGNIHDYAGMIKECYELALLVPLDPRSEAELAAKSETLPISDPAKRPRKPIIQRFNEADLKPNPYLAENGLPPLPKVPKPPKAPREPGAAPSKGATGRVWEIAESVRAAMNNAPIDKAMRTAIIQACENAGINAGTAATQFGKWKATQQ